MALEKLKEDYFRYRAGVAIIKALGENSNLTKRKLWGEALNSVEKFGIGRGRINDAISKLEDDEIKVTRKSGKDGHLYSLTQKGHEMYEELKSKQFIILEN